MMEPADWIMSAESSLAAILGEIDIANAAHFMAPIKYANDENDMSSAVNSRQSKSSRDFGSGICFGKISFGISHNKSQNGS